MEDTSSQLNPGNQKEGVHIHQTLGNQHCDNDHGEMPPLRDVVRIVESDDALKNVRCHIGNASKQRDPGEPSHPSLNPRNESSMAFGC